MEKSRMNLPKRPDTLCFDKDEFMKEDFAVDHFVSDCQKRVQLEALRDDLELYHKLLKTAMVELINKDYADFVNLSTNLIGMDKALNQLSAPLGQLGEEVLVIPSVEKIEKILNSQNSKETSALEAISPLLTGQMLERIVTEFNQLQFHAVQIKGLPLLDKIRPVTVVVILEQIVDSHLSDLQLMYDKLLEFVPHRCCLLREVTGGAISREIVGSLEAALTDVLEDEPAGSSYRLLASHRTWSSLQRCWSVKMFLPLLAHRLWRLTLQILVRYSIFVKEPLLGPIYNESAKDIKKPLVTGSKDLSITQGHRKDQVSGPSETKPIVSISSTQLIYVVTDLDRLHEQIEPLPHNKRSHCSEKPTHH